MCLSLELLHAPPNCFSVVSFVFLCVVVSHCPHRPTLALRNVNCVRTNDLFRVLLFLLLLDLLGLIIICPLPPVLPHVW